MSSFGNSRRAGNGFLPALSALLMVVAATAGGEEKPTAKPAADTAASDASEQVDFARDVWPIFVERCNTCHGEDQQEGQLRLDARAIVMQGGVSGPAIVGGKAGESLLVKRILAESEEERMPLEDDPLTAEQIDVIRRWIDQGAKWPEGVGADIAPIARHWAYVSPARAPLPEVKSRHWPSGAIDRFVLARLEKEGLSPSPPAERARLLRRVYLDLIGLPPTVQEVEAFLRDERPGAYERVVERLLASPEYGKRWARPWLDAARYADSNGYQADQYRNVWPYRDWVIDSMNRGMPFDRFTIEQLAGDLLPDATLDQKIASGFHRLTTCNVEAGVDPEENRVNQIIDRVNTTGTVWLGTSIECGQCHNHKYDPFTQRDYYRLFAYFNNTPLEVEGNGVTYNFVGPKMDLPLTDEQQQQKAELTAKRDGIKKKLDELIAARTPEQAAWEDKIAAAQKNMPQWHVLDIESFESSGGAAYTTLVDKSVLVGGAAPEMDNYIVTARTEIEGITGFKLEALADASLPGNGPGRGSAERPNFVLYEFTVAAGSCAEEGECLPVSLHSASADFSQARWDVGGAIDGDPKTGWAINPQFGKDHQATFLTHEPLALEGGTRLVFTFDQHYGGARTIGRLRLSVMTGAPSESKLPDNIAKIVSTPAEKRKPKQQQELAEYFQDLDPEIKKTRQQLAATDKQLAAIKPLTTLVMVEDEMRESAVFRRGDFQARGEKVTPGTPAALNPIDPEAPADRLGLARWLVDRENPLTARVAVNRWWAEIFGRGIVATLEDFGTQGELPTHPQLLDYLALELMESGWSQKHVHRLIVTSKTYRQSAKVTDELLARDPGNLLLARGPRFRLSAETVRDNALVASGLFTSRLGGPPIYPPQPDGIWRHVGRNAPKYDTSQGTNRFRRGVYVVWRRSAPYPSFTNFDAPDRASCVVARGRTNTPLQALTLLNDPAYIEMAMALADRMAADNPYASAEQKAAYGFRRVLAREPSEKELAHLVSVYRREAKRLAAVPAAAEKLIGKNPHSDKVDAPELAAWFFVANILLNLDETITKG